MNFTVLTKIVNAFYYFTKACNTQSGTKLL